jgi:4-amino-4-deoxy-L-arabinose transferase-like glycosyltransferase
LNEREYRGGILLSNGAANRWWLELEVLGLILLVIVAYFLRAGDLPLRGEEPTRAQMAYEMVARNDYLIPREQGEPFRIRPPVQNWAIAAAYKLLGSRDEFAVRFHAVLSTLLMTLVVYGYSRSFLSRLAAFAAALSFATFADWLTMGRQAETEAIFTFLLGTALLTWHWGLMRRWPLALTFSLGYGFMALAMMSKGMQAPMYFVGATWGYLLLTRDWQRLVSLGHVVGIAAGAAVLLAWVIPYANSMGWDEVRMIWMGDPAYRVNGRPQDWKGGEFAMHLLSYPLEVLAGTLPWSLLLVLYLFRGFRKTLGVYRPYAVYLGVCLGVAFPTCWIPPGGLPRYYSPLFPAMAVLIGIVIQRIFEAQPGTKERIVWRLFACIAAVALALAGVAELLISLFFTQNNLLGHLAEPPIVALGFMLCAIVLAAIVHRARKGSGIRSAILAIAAFMVLCFTGLVTDSRLRRSENPAQAMAEIKSRLPADQQLVSLGLHAHPLFAYHYGQPFIIPKPFPAAGEPFDPALPYFCILWVGESRPELPFAWEEIGAFSLDRYTRPVPKFVMVVGKRLK